MSKNEQTVDILIIGGGLTGAALMLALQEQDLKVLLVDSHDLTRHAAVHFDARSLALAPASVDILQQLDCWSSILPHATPIHKIHVSQQGYFGTSRLQGKPGHPLGHVVELPYIAQAIHQRLALQHVMAPAELVNLDIQQSLATVKQNGKTTQVRAQLIVAADGGHSSVRSYSSLPIKVKTYPQKALVANIALKRPHQYCAYERFTADGPLALLPMTEQRSALVWCLPPNKALALQCAVDKDFLKALQTAFGYRLGQLIKVGARSLFPLQEIIMPQQVSWPLVFIGNAAHTLHPVAGQGFNLGLRDVATLAQCIIQDGLHAGMLARYQSLREADQTAIIGFTDGLIQLFGHQWPGLGFARSMGLLAVDNVSLLKNQLARYAQGYGGIVPDLVCGLSFPIPKNRGSSL